VSAARDQTPQREVVGVTGVPDEFVPDNRAVIGDDVNWMGRFEEGDRVSLVLGGGDGDTRPVPATAVYRGYVVPETGNEAPGGIGGFELPNGDRVRVYFGDKTATLHRDGAAVSLPAEMKFQSIKPFNGWLK
jgi:hypothetical protein